MSFLQKKRLEYKPSIPEILKDLKNAHFQPLKTPSPPNPSIQKLFPHTFAQPTYQLMEGTAPQSTLKIGVVFSGGPAAGGHNVIAALCDAGAKVIGFLDGPGGIVENRSIAIDLAKVAPYRNQGGFDLIGTGRVKIETAEQLEASLETALAHKLDGLVIIGGDDSNTNGAVLAEYFLSKGCKTRVVGVPKTIDGDLQSDDIAISFGFDSACKTYAEIIGNLARDALSTKKYYHFVKLMGRSASHIALECALATRPNLTLIGEEGKGLYQIVEEITDLICRRAAAGKEYGVILLPEGLVEFMPEMKNPNALPEKIRDQLALEKDPHGNIQVSKIETEQLVIDLVKKELKKGNFQGKFDPQEHFLGYEGRSCLPSNFDANYCYALGLVAAAAIRDHLTGVICAVRNLKKEPRAWEVRAVPIVQLIHLEVRKGVEKPVIKKVLVDTKGDSFINFSLIRKKWEIEDHYSYPGPIQFWGGAELTDSIPATLRF